MTKLSHSAWMSLVEKLMEKAGEGPMIADEQMNAQDAYSMGWLPSRFVKAMTDRREWQRAKLSGERMY